MPRHDRFVEAPVGSIDPLHGVSFGSIHFVEIGLFQIRLDQLARGVRAMNIVFVRWIRTPVTGGRIDVHCDQPVAIETRRKQRIDLARRVVAAADFYLNPIRHDRTKDV